jgi:hypothetical protein
MDNTKHDIVVGGKPVNGHTAKPIDPSNPPKADAAKTNPIPNPPVADKIAGK